MHAVENRLLGSIIGKIRNTNGVEQMGATILLLNRNERVVRRTISNVAGEFQFHSLPSDLYSIKVNLNTYVPAKRGAIQVRPGVASFLNIQLANLFSSIELVYAAPGQTGLLSDDWEWTLRTNAATRPVLRFHDGILHPGWSSSRENVSAFSMTHGLVRVSAGDSTSDFYGSAADLGTAFAIATSLFGSNELRVSGNVGYASQSGTPTTGFRAGYTRRDAAGEGLSPNVELTVRQVAARGRATQGLFNAAAEVPLLRTMAVKVGNRQQLTDAASLDYGMALETVVFLERLNVFSPYARLNYDLNEWGLFQMAYSTGSAAFDLIESPVPGQAEGSLAAELTGLAVFPRVSVSSGDARIQRVTTYEIGYVKRLGRNSVNASVYRDILRDSSFLAAGATSSLNGGDLLPDLASNSYVFNAGSQQSTGYAVTITRELSDDWRLSGGFGSSGALTAGGGAVPPEDAQEIRESLRAARLSWITGRLAGVVPVAGTRVSSSYMHLASGTMVLPHAYLTQRTQIMPGLNVQVRQPLPQMGGMPGRLEIAADLRNLLAQGYLPMTAPDGRALWLIPVPRSLRGGVSFIF